MGSAVSLEHWDTVLIPSLAQWIKDPALLQQWHRLQLQLGSDPWPGNSICYRVSKKEKKKKIYIYIYRHYFFPCWLYVVPLKLKEKTLNYCAPFFFFLFCFFRAALAAYGSSKAGVELEL